MTEFKIPSDGAVLVPETKDEIRDWPTYYYNTERYREYVDRRAWYRRGKAYKRPYPALQWALMAMHLDIKRVAAKEFVDNLENIE